MEFFNILSYSRAFLNQFLEKSAYLERNCKYTRFVCFDRWLRSCDHKSTNKVLLLLKEYLLFIGYLYYSSVHFHSCCLLHNDNRETVSVKFLRELFSAQPMHL